jgi:protein tyrosine kinase modulator
MNMAEEFESEAVAEFDWKKYRAIALRRRWIFMITCFVVWIVVWTASWFIPSVYRSSTLILVERPNTQVVAANSTQDFQGRLDSITQQVLSRTRLLRIINNLNLYSEQRSHGVSDDDLVERMRKKIEIELVRAPDRGLSSFNIYFSADSPDVAQRVTTELTNVLITENLEATQEQTENTSKFLQSQLDDARKKLSAQEDQVRVFKDQHIGELPSQLQSNLQILSGLQSQLQGEQDALGRARQQNAYLESLLSQYSALAKNTKAGDTGAMGLPAVDQELDRLRAQLADLSSHYTDQHPDVRKVKEQIAKTERMKEQLTAELKSRPSDPHAASDSEYSGNAPLMEVRSQLKANQIEMGNRQRAIDTLQVQIENYQARLNRTPIREQELADLTRDYDQSRVYYDQLLAKKNQADLSAKLSEAQQDEHFSMVDPPSRPSKPFSPNRLKLSFMGLFGGLVLGVGAAAGREYLDDRVYDEETFHRLLPAEVMAEIPPLPTAPEKQHQERMFWLGWACTGLLGLLVMAGTAFSFLRG